MVCQFPVFSRKLKTRFHDWVSCHSTYRNSSDSERLTSAFIVQSDFYGTFDVTRRVLSFYVVFHSKHVHTRNQKLKQKLTR